MPRPLSPALCNIIKTELGMGIDLETLKSRHRISDNKARTMMKLYQETGDVVGKLRRKPGGRPGKLKEEHVERLKTFLADHPEAFLRDMSLMMELEFGLEVNESTMYRCCQRIGWSLKKQPRPRNELGGWARTLPRDENDVVIRAVRTPKKRPAGHGEKLSYKLKKRLLEKTREFVKEYMSQPQFDASHDYNHVLRVVALSFEILRVEQNMFKKIVFDGTLVELVALMHDIDDHKYQTPANRPDGYPSPPSDTDPQPQPTPCDIDPSNPAQNQPAPNPINVNHHPQNAPYVQSSVEFHLLQLGWPIHVASKVAAITPFISYTTETTNKPGFASAIARYPELAIVQDADRLDAIGATGIGRAFTYGGAKAREGGMAGTMKHFGEKLVKLEGMMKTGEGKRLAVARAERLRIFGRWWLEEMRMVGMAEEEGMEWVQSSSPWAGHGPPTLYPIPPQQRIDQSPPGTANQGTAAAEQRPRNMGEWEQQQQQQQQQVSTSVVSEQEHSAQGRNEDQQEAEDYDPGRQLVEAMERSV